MTHAARTIKKLNVGVFMGGKSIEREVSFNSGRTVCDHLDAYAYDIVPIFQTESGELYILPWHFLHRGKIADFRQRLDDEAEKIIWDDLRGRVDFVYIAVHGRYAEDGILQGMLELMNISYLGAKVLGSALSMDKVMHKQLLSMDGIRVPRGIVIKDYEIDKITFDEIKQRLGAQKVSFPLVVKPSHEGSSLGISVVKDEHELISAIHLAGHADHTQAQDVIVEEKIEGMEFVCVSLQKEGEWFSLPITEVVIEKETDFFDYEQKYMPGRASKITPARCSEKDQQTIRKTCQNVAKILNFTTTARIDGFLTGEGDVVIIDPNSLTGMAPATFLFHQAAESGMSHTDLINFLIEQELQVCGLVDMQKKCQNKEKKMHTGDAEKVRVAVLLGGDSDEREVSLESGRNVCYKLSPHKYDVIPLFVDDTMHLYRLSKKLLIKNSTHEINELLTPDIHVKWSDLPNLCDFVFIGLHGGKGENGAVQGALEMLNMPYNGSGVLCSALCMDKFKTNAFLKGKAFNVPEARLVEHTWWKQQAVKEQQQFLQQFIENVSLPIIVKPYNDGCSIFVEKASDLQEICTLLQKLFAAGKDAVLLEECIKGMELTCGVYGNDEPHAFPPSQAIVHDDVLSIKEKFLPGEGQNLTPAPLSVAATKLVKQTMQDAYKIIGCKGYARIDCFYHAKNESPDGVERVIILEINSLPALTPATCLFHQAAEVGMKPMEFIDRIIELGLQNHKNKLQSKTSGLKQQESCLQAVEI